jgi:uncharacterized protein
VKIAIIGTGIAGNVAAYQLSGEHDITVFEAGSHIGGHTHTHAIEQAGKTYAVDTGFIVFNDWTYPNFNRLLAHLNVASQPSNMSFSVQVERSELEYNGSSLNTLFAQRRNLVRPSFWRMIQDILRFNREAPALIAKRDHHLTLGDYLTANEYSRAFIDHYIVPMGAAIWSTDPANIKRFPAQYFVRFFHNHGMLSVDNRPQWRVIRGGSARYVEALTARFRNRIRLNCPVRSIRRAAGHVYIKYDAGEAERFDAVFIGCHSDQALAMLADASPLEREILGAIPYQTNEAVLHTDTRVMPRARRAWAAWNYHVLDAPDTPVALTYNMNILQSLDAPAPFLVTLNRSDAIAPGHVLKRIRYEHPLFTPDAVSAQTRQGEINGPLNTYFCGAYWRFGFHEDGVVSAMNAVAQFHTHRYGQRPLSRVS